MPTEIIIGRSSASPLKVPEDRVAVSGKHIKITVSDNGDWKLEDLQSSNGTFVRNENFEFERVYSRQIHESDIIRLGNDGANSFVFCARRAMYPNDNYAYEFKQLQRLLKQSRKEEAEKEKKANWASWVISIGAFVVWGITEIVEKFLKIDSDPNKRMIIMMGVPPLLKIMLGNFTKGTKTVKKTREKFMLCPKCGKRISEFDVEQGQCSKCKAK